MGDEHDPAGFRAGHMIGGKYRVVRLLGAGGMGAVYEAENTWTTRRVAIKVLQPDVAGNEGIVKRFRVEAIAATKLSHPHIVDVLDMGEDADTGALFLVQEYLEGRDLRLHLDEVKRMSPSDALEVLVPIIAALVSAHERNILHRDLKPENIFLVRSPSGDVTPKLIDFGLALMDTGLAPTRMTRTGAVMGTPYYMSPEQARGDKAIDGRSDVWAIATVLYELLAGAPPFDAPTYNLLVYRILSETPPRIEATEPSVPGALADVIHRALTPALAARTPDMRTFLAELLECRYLPGDRRDDALRERHRKVLPAASRPSAEPPPSELHANTHALARTLTPAEVVGAAVRPTALEADELVVVSKVQSPSPDTKPDAEPDAEPDPAQRPIRRRTRDRPWPPSNTTRPLLRRHAPRTPGWRARAIPAAG